MTKRKKKRTAELTASNEMQSKVMQQSTTVTEENTGGN